MSFSLLGFKSLVSISLFGLLVFTVVQSFVSVSLLAVFSHVVFQVSDVIYCFGSFNILGFLVKFFLPFQFLSLLSLYVFMIFTSLGGSSKYKLPHQQEGDRSGGNKEKAPPHLPLLFYTIKSKRTKNEKGFTVCFGLWG